MSAGMFITIAGLLVAATSSLLGVWLERDPSRPARNGFLLSAMILSAAAVGVAQASLNRQDNEQMTANMARMLDDLVTLSKTDPAVDKYLSEQIRAQAQANPEVIDRMAERVRARGEEPSGVLSRHGLTAGDLSTLGLPPAPPVVVEPGVTVNDAKPEDVTIGDIAKDRVKLDDVMIADVKIGKVKLEDIKTSDLKVGDLGEEDLKKLEDLKKREIEKLQALKKAAELKKLEELQKRLGLP